MILGTGGDNTSRISPDLDTIPGFHSLNPAIFNHMLNNFVIQIHLSITIGIIKSLNALIFEEIDTELRLSIEHASE